MCDDEQRIAPAHPASPGGIAARGSARFRVRVASTMAVAAALGALFHNSRRYYPFISDDAFISLRYAERWIEGHGLTWTDGPPVEGYSNLLWTLLCGVLGAVGLDLVLAARALGFLGMGAVLLAILWAVRPRRPLEVAAAAVGMAAFAVAGPVGAWAVGGLEQPLVAGLLGWALAACAPLLAPEPVSRRQILVPGSLLALVTLSRVDGAVLVAAVCLGLVVVRGLRTQGWERAALLAALPLAAFLAQLCFRVLYYDAWIPNTALVKVAFTVDRLGSGIEYVLDAARSSVLLLVLGALPLPLAIGAGQRGPRWRHACLAWIVAVVWAGYVLFVGGDIFPAYRHWVPTLVAVCMAAALGLCVVAQRWPRLEWAPLVAGLCVVVVFGVRQPRDPDNRRAVTERWEFNGEVVGRLLHRAFGDREPLLAAAAIGSLCYHARLPCLDMLGLNDRHIARHRPDDFGTGFIGHELGDGVYAMSRLPDLVVFCGPIGRVKPCSHGEVEMVAQPEFHLDYQMVRFRGAEPFEVVARIWVRRLGRIGIETSADDVVVPGHLLSAVDANAELDGDGRIGLRLAAGKVAHVYLPLGPGRWRLRVETDSGSAASVTVTDPADGSKHAGGDELAFELDDHTPAVGRARVQVRATERLHIRSLAVERDP